MTALLPDRGSAELWCDRLWDDRPGWAITAVGRDSYVTPTPAGRYAFRAFQQRSFRWPYLRDQLLEGLVGSRLSAPSRRLVERLAIDGQVAYVDEATGLLSAEPESTPHPPNRSN